MAIPKHGDCKDALKRMVFDHLRCSQIVPLCLVPFYTTKAQQRKKQRYRSMVVGGHPKTSSSVFAPKKVLWSGKDSGRSEFLDEFKLHLNQLFNRTTVVVSRVPLVFLDPPNGLAKTRDLQLTEKKSAKHLTITELADLVSRFPQGVFCFYQDCGGLTDENVKKLVIRTQRRLKGCSICAYRGGAAALVFASRNHNHIAAVLKALRYHLPFKRITYRLV